jgi:hypothetical protein
MVLEIAAADLKWFEEMRESDWEFCAEEHSLATTPHLDRDCHCNQYSQVTSMESVTSSLCRDASTADTTEDDLRQLENALQPLKEDLINSSITYAKHMESLAKFSVEIRRGLSKTLSNQAVLEQVAGRVLMIDFASCSTRFVLKLKHQPRCSPIRTGGRLLSDGTMAKSLGPYGHAGAAARAQSKRGKSHVGVLAAAAAAAARRSGGMNALSLPLSLPPSFSISRRLFPRHPGRSPPLRTPRRSSTTSTPPSPPAAPSPPPTTPPPPAPTARSSPPSTPSPPPPARPRAARPSSAPTARPSPRPPPAPRGCGGRRR